MLGLVSAEGCKLCMHLYGGKAAMLVSMFQQRVLEIVNSLFKSSSKNVILISCGERSMW